MVKCSSVITVLTFDQRKFERRDQSFLGFVEIRIADYLDLELGGLGMFSGLLSSCFSSLMTNQCIPHRANFIRPEGHRRQFGRARQTYISPLHAS